MTSTTRTALAGVRWRKSSRSGDEGACVEMGVVADPAATRDTGATVAVRDSKDPEGPVLLFPRAAWTAFAATPPGSRAGTVDPTGGPAPRP